MKLNRVSTDAIIKYVEARYPESFCVRGRVDSVEGFCSLAHPRSNCLVWIKDIDSFDLHRLSCYSGLLFIGNKMVEEVPDGMCFIACKDSKAAFFSVVEHFFIQKKGAEISDKAVIETDRIGANVSIGHFTYICEDVTIGDNVTIGTNVSIECPCSIGCNTVIGSGTVIGNDGYGYYTDSTGHSKKVPHTGGVQIGCYVEIGANVCIDRGTIDDTVIKDYVKIDNLCHIAHNVTIEEDAMVVALSLLGGSSCVGKGAYLAPGVMVMNQRHIGADALVGMGAVVLQDAPPNMVLAGVPARVLKKKGL